jgi:Ser/Thr protein kinase RdoA (MazF antagonist)
MMEPEEPLPGGNLTPVVRVGSTVRRAQGPWSPAIHALLRHLEDVGFAGAPRFLGIDAQGREVLSYLPGRAGFFADVWREESLVAAARLLRDYHEATLSFRSLPRAAWQLTYPDPTQHEVLCHNDAAPYNIVFVDGVPTALIDFDLAGPGPRLWDLAYALYWFAPLYPHKLPTARGLDDLPQTSRRIQAFCAAYGVPYTPRLLDFVDARLHEMCTRLHDRAAANDVVAQRMIREGHLAGYQRALATFRAHRPALEAQLATR